MLSEIFTDDCGNAFAPKAATVLAVVADDVLGPANGGVSTRLNYSRAGPRFCASMTSPKAVTIPFLARLVVASAQQCRHPEVRH